MPTLAEYRVIGHTFSLCMHGANSLVMLSSMQDRELMKDPQLQELASMQFEFYTVWNIIFQVAYSSLGLACDLLTSSNKEHLIPKPIKKFRETFFTSIVLPGTLMIAVVFWPIFIYDREILYPAFIDKLFSPKSNYVMHLGIIPVVLWELALLPRMKPKTHRNNMFWIMMNFIAYNTRIFYVYYHRGLWPYPIFKMTFGTIYFALFHLFILAILFSSYYVQWGLMTVFWGKEKKKIK